MSPIHIFLPFLLVLPVLSHELHHKAFRAWKTPKVNKHRLSLIIQRLKLNETKRLDGADLSDIHQSTDPVSKLTASEQCPMFQSFSSCACEPTCNNPNPYCPNCEPGCTCRNGFVRSSLHLCVLPEECPRTKLRRFELQAPRRLYEAVPVVLSSTTTTEEPTTTEPSLPSTTTESFLIEEMVTVPLLVLRNGPTPPSAPPMLQEPSDMIGAPSATPPPDFSYGPPGMNAAKVALYENFLKQKKIMKALRHRRNQFAKRML
ncbi:hypothetical protein GCK72_016575 [Caenorhabditis remanei]|uniref:TIL domain-containing protein n=1 Tax=Caenorhabditis remanei TaxID=31234 RepID=A0A6A5G513_CAERE|nr:hypothetical protein GCK72_016575 [Caenorhabditis remanei]KAF1750030.1 hypothetical protein GCK72_016575 [Caenorhabditis remanei]